MHVTRDPGFWGSLLHHSTPQVKAALIAGLIAIITLIGTSLVNILAAASARKAARALEQQRAEYAKTLASAQSDRKWEENRREQLRDYALDFARLAVRQAELVSSAKRASLQDAPKVLDENHAELRVAYSRLALVASSRGTQLSAKWVRRVAWNLKAEALSDRTSRYSFPEKASPSKIMQETLAPFMTAVREELAVPGSWLEETDAGLPSGAARVPYPGPRTLEEIIGDA